MEESRVKRPRLQCLQKADLRFILYGGKGGVGKTVCAAATGLCMARQGRRTLVCSVDPAHSLTDCFGQTIGDRINQVNGVDGLYALEIEAGQVFEDLKKRYRDVVDEALGRFLAVVDLPFEREIIHDIMDLLPPGLDELMALSKLNDIVRSGQFDLIVVDMAAGAHAIRLLGLPLLVEEWFHEAFRLLDRYESVMPFEKGRELMEGLRQDVEALRVMLTDPERTSFITVTIPEAMGIYVTEDMVRGLDSCRMPYEDIVINFAIPSDVECNFCIQRRKSQRKRIEEIYEKFPRCGIVEVPVFPGEIRGIESLTSFAKALFEGVYEPRFTRGESRALVEATPIVERKPRLDLSRKGLKFVLFGGKGGCGKTTSAAAAGIYMANHGKRTVVLSTDPQRSLSDSFEQEVGEEPTLIKSVENLYALEINAERLLEDFKREHGEEILEIASRATIFEKEELAGFLDLSLPGLDEFMALMKLTDMMREGRYDLFILDTAPTGHTLRFLELPSLMSNWVKLITKMRAKTQYVVQAFFRRSLREKPDIFLEKMLSDINRVKSNLTNHGQTEFIPVTTLEEMAIRESERLISQLKYRNILVRQIVGNGLVPPNPGCGYCRSDMEIQQSELQDLCREFPGLSIVQMPLFPSEIRGIARLTDFAEALFGSLGRHGM